MSEDKGKVQPGQIYEHWTGAMIQVREIIEIALDIKSGLTINDNRDWVAASDAVMGDTVVYQICGRKEFVWHELKDFSADISVRGETVKRFSLIPVRVVK